MSRRRVVPLGLAGAVVVGCLIAARLASPPRPGASPARPGPAVGIRSARPTAPASAPAASLAGASAAAVSFATDSQNWLYLSDAEIDREVLSVATPGAGARLAAQTVSDMAAARQSLAASPGPVWWLVRPLAVRMDSFSPPTARAEVWVVTVLCAPGVAAPQADWETVVTDLSWAADTGTWKLASITETSGPTPLAANQQAAWGADAFDSALAGYQRIGSSK